MNSLKKHEEEINLQLTERFVDQWRRYNDRLVEPPGLTPQVSMPESPTAPRGDRRLSVGFGFASRSARMVRRFFCTGVRRANNRAGSGTP